MICSPLLNNHTILNYIRLLFLKVSNFPTTQKPKIEYEVNSVRMENTIYYPYRTPLVTA